MKEQIDLVRRLRHGYMSIGVEGSNGQVLDGAMRTAFPDNHWTVEEIVAEGNSWHERPMVIDLAIGKGLNCW